MFTYTKVLDCLPKTTDVHEKLASEIWKRFRARPAHPRTEHDPVFRVRINNTDFVVDIVAERDSKTNYALPSDGIFPWNGRWNLCLDCGGATGRTFRPFDTRLDLAAAKIADEIEKYLKFWAKKETGRFPRLVVDNTIEKS